MPHNTPEKRRAYAATWRAKNREKIRQHWKQWHEHPNHLASCERARQRYAQAHPERLRMSAQLHRLRLDGVSEIEITKARIALENFSGQCATCSVVNPEHRRGFTLDHDHLTKRFRGIICAHCNSVMGLAKDSPELLRRLADWIEEHRG